MTLTPSENISELRNSIDDLDLKICDLLIKRSNLVKDVVKLKHKTGKSTFDPLREAKIIKKRQKICPELWPTIGYTHLWREIISCSLLQQNNLWSLFIEDKVSGNLFSLVRAHVGFGMKLIKSNNSSTGPLNPLESWDSIGIKFQNNNTMLALLATTLYRLGSPPPGYRVFKIIVDKKEATSPLLVSNDICSIEKNGVLEICDAENICVLMTKLDDSQTYVGSSYNVSLKNKNDRLNNKIIMKISGRLVSDSEYIDIGLIDSSDIS